MVNVRQAGRRVSLAEADPDLVKAFDGAVAQRIREASMAEVLELPAGEWPRELGRPRPLFGVFVLDGLLSRTVVVGGRRSTELLGPGDLLRPSASDEVDSSVEFLVSWEMLEPTRLALLDERFAEAVSQWPRFTAALMDRMMRRTHSLGVHLAVSNLKLVEDRLLVILWYYADRWGRVTREGVVLPLRLTHGMLARIVGARRPSVSTALGRLSARGLAERTPEGHWLLLGNPPASLDSLSDEALSA